MLFTLRGRIYADHFVDSDGNELPLFSKWTPVKDEVFAQCMFFKEKLLILKYIKIS